MPQRLRAMPFRKSPWKDRYPELLTLLEDEPGLPKGNVIRRNISWGGEWLNVEEKAKPLVRFEQNLVDRDPLFTGDVRAENATVLDFGLQPASPALEFGFEPIPLEKISLLRSER